MRKKCGNRKKILLNFFKYQAEGGNEVKEGVTVCWKNVSVIAKVSCIIH